jgi:hypothetical protein
MRVVWTPEEWRAVAKSLMSVRQEYATSLPQTIYQTDLAKAIEALPAERRRRMPVSGATTQFRPGLERAYAELLTPPPTVPAPRRSESDAPKQRKVFWRADEYLELARELHRNDPGASYPLSTTLAGLTPAALREAERRALPEDRQRNLHTVSGVKSHFLEAFKAVKEELGGHATYEAKEAAELEAKRRDITENPERYGLPRPIPPAPVNPYEAAVKPFFDFFMDQFMARMAQQYPMPTHRQESAPMAHSQIERAPMGFQPPVRPVIAIVGAMSAQSQDLAKEFPEFQIIGIQESTATNIISKLQSAARVVGMTKFMRHGADGALLKHFGEKYCRVHGGVSAIKRQIQIWISTGALQA